LIGGVVKESHLHGLVVDKAPVKRILKLSNKSSDPT